MVRSASRPSTPAEGVLKQEITFPQSSNQEPEANLVPLSFWEEIYAVPANAWWSGGDEKGFKVYLYDHEVPRSPYLEIITQAFDVEWIKQKFGGGMYRAQLNDPYGKIVCKEIFSIIGESKRKPPVSVPAVTANQSADSFQSELLRMMREEQQETRRLFSQMMDRQGNHGAPPASAVDPTTLFRGMVEMFKEMVPAKPEMNLLETIALVEKLRGPDLLTVLKQAKEAGIIAGAGAPGGGGDLIKQINQLKEAAESLGLSSGGGKGFTEALIEKGPEILQAGAKLIGEYKSVEETRLQTARTVHAIQQQRGGGAVIPPPPQQHQEMAQHVHTAPAGVGLEVEVPSPAAQAALSDAEQRDKFVKQKLVEAIARGDNGDQIVYFLDTIDEAICTMFEGATVEQIAQYFSTDEILKKATALPRFRPALAEIVEVLNAPDEDLPGSGKAVN